MSSHDQVAAILGTEILKGIHRPGGNMPPEPELIQRFSPASSKTTRWLPGASTPTCSRGECASGSTTTSCNA